jgi:hypothetical protein
MTSDRPRARWARRFVALVLCSAVLACFRAPALAQGGDETAYKELIEQALEEFKLKNWPEARVLFRKAHERMPNARTLRGMGVVSFEMRDYVAATQALSAALVDARQPLTDAQRAECESLLARARTFVASYQLDVDPADAQISLDGGPLVRDREGLVLVPFGEHTLRASAPGHHEVTRRLAVQGGERATIELKLAPEPEASAPAVATSAPEPSEPVQPSSETSPEPAERSFVGGGLRYTWVALGAAVLFGGASVGLYYAGESELDELDARCARRAAQGNPCQRGKTNTEVIERYERLTNAGIGLAATAGAAAVVLAALEWPRERNVALDVGINHVSVRGSF